MLMQVSVNVCSDVAHQISIAFTFCVKRFLWIGVGTESTLLTDERKL